MTRALPAPLVKSLPFILPLSAIALARLLTHSAWAADNSGWAAVLFAWIVADSLLLALLAKAPNRKPGAFQVAGVLSLVSLVVLAGAAAPVRDVYFALPQVLIAAAATLTVFLGWSAVRIALAYRQTGSLIAGLGEVLPPILVKHMVSECQIFALGLFRWGVPADIPSGTRAFAYHTYLTPMIATFVTLQLIELSVVHLLLMLWNPTVAWAMLALSVWGVIWTVALLKSFRINPVLLTEHTVRVRSGMIYDFHVPRHFIRLDKGAFSADELDDKRVLNLAIMSSPNVSLRFAKPIVIKTFFGGSREISGVALRLDDGETFLTELAADR
ncbi:MAG: hypothetical protein AAF941_05700 [Pseudomonadota bacterium]